MHHKDHIWFVFTILSVQTQYSLVVILCQGRIQDTAIETVSAISPVRLDSCNLEDSGCNQAYRLAPHDKGTIQSILQVVISGPPVLVEYLFVSEIFNNRDFSWHSLSNNILVRTPKGRECFHVRPEWTLSNLPVLLLLLQLSLLFEAQLRRLLAFLDPLAFLFHNPSSPIPLSSRYALCPS